MRVGENQAQSRESLLHSTTDPYRGQGVIAYRRDLGDRWGLSRDVPCRARFPTRRGLLMDLEWDQERRAAHSAHRPGTDSSFRST